MHVYEHKGNIFSTSSEPVSLSKLILFSCTALAIARIAGREPELPGAWQRARRPKNKQQSCIIIIIVVVVVAVVSTTATTTQRRHCFYFCHCVSARPNAPEFPSFVAADPLIMDADYVGALGLGTH
jgi:hypothetical protein